MNVEIVERVKSELEQTFSHLTSPGDAYVMLGLDGIEGNLFDSPKSLYWMRYCSWNNSKKATKTSTLNILFERYGKEKFLNDFNKFLKGFKGSDWTKDLQVEIKKAGIVLKNEYKTSVRKVVHNIQQRIQDRCALKTAANAYFSRHQEVEIILYKYSGDLSQ